MELHDYNEYDNLIQDYRKLENKNCHNIFAKYYFDGLIILYCGNYLKFGRLAKMEAQSGSRAYAALGDNKKGKNKKMRVFEKNPETNQVFTDINCTLDDSVEIIKLIETGAPDCIQIVFNNYDKNIFTVLTWDFNLNIEKSIYQIRNEIDSPIGNHVIKGMNYKMNYFLDAHYLNDLEYNIPIKQKNVMQDVDPLRVSYSR